MGILLGNFACLNAVIFFHNPESLPFRPRDNALQFLISLREVTGVTSVLIVLYQDFTLN